MPMQALKPQVAPVGPSGGGVNILAAGRQDVPQSRPDTQVLDAVGELGQGLAQYAGVIAGAELRLKQERDAIEIAQKTSEFSLKLHTDLNQNWRLRKGKDAQGMTLKASEDLQASMKSYSETIPDERLRAEFVSRAIPLVGAALDDISGFEAKSHEEDKKDAIAGSLASTEVAVRASGAAVKPDQALAAIEAAKANYATLNAGKDNTAAFLEIDQKLWGAYFLEMGERAAGAVESQAKAFEGILPAEFLADITKKAKAKDKQDKLSAVIDIGINASDEASGLALVMASKEVSGSDKVQAQQAVSASFGIRRQEAERVKREADAETVLELTIGFARGAKNPTTPALIMASGLEPEAKTRLIEAHMRIKESRDAQAQAERERREALARYWADKKEAERQENARIQLITDMNNGSATPSQTIAKAKALGSGFYGAVLPDIYRAAARRPLAPGADWRKDEARSALAKQGYSVDVVLSQAFIGVTNGTITDYSELVPAIGKGLSLDDAMSLGRTLSEKKRGSLNEADQRAKEQSLALLKETYKEEAPYMIQSFFQDTHGLHGDDIFKVARDYVQTINYGWWSGKKKGEPGRKAAESKGLAPKPTEKR
jgi:hypothetical protein